jgi:hypothetical protein
MGAKGEDFWEWLCPDGKVNAAAATNVAFDHLETRNAIYQERFRALPGRDVNTVVQTENGDSYYFRFYGGLEVESERSFSSAAGGNMYRSFGNYISDELTGRVAYLYLGIHPPEVAKSGHALGLKAKSDGKLCFYDPNIGEFEFDSPGGFKDWLENVFARVEAYATYTCMTCAVLVKRDPYWLT